MYFVNDVARSMSSASMPRLRKSNAYPDVICIFLDDQLFGSTKFAEILSNWDFYDTRQVVYRPAILTVEQLGRGHSREMRTRMLPTLEAVLGGFGKHPAVRTAENYSLVPQQSVLGD